MSIDPPKAEWNRFRLRLRLRLDTPLSRSKIDRSTKDSRQAEYIIRCSMLDVRCSTFISFFSLIWLDACGQRQRSWLNSGIWISIT